MNYFKSIYETNKLYVIFIFAIFTVFIVPFFNVDFSDNPYQINIANYYNENNSFISGFTFFSQFIYAKVILLFGDNFIVLKLLNSVIVLFTAFVPFFLLLDYIKPKLYIFYASIAIVFFVPFSRLSIGWDAVSDFFIIVSVCFLIKWLFKNKL